MVSDERLYEQLLGGDLSAFDTLYERYEPVLFGFIRKHLADKHEAEDILHETFMALLRERAQGRAARSFRAWMFQVARNLCLNRLRSRKRAARAMAAMKRAPAAPAEQPEHALLKREAAARLSQAVARLPVPLGELYALRASGLSYAELAQLLDVPLGTIKSRMHEMVNRLRQEMVS